MTGTVSAQRHFAARRAHGFPPPGLRHLPAAAQAPCFATDGLAMGDMSGLIIGAPLIFQAKSLATRAKVLISIHTPPPILTPKYSSLVVFCSTAHCWLSCCLRLVMRTQRGHSQPFSVKSMLLQTLANIHSLINNPRHEALL
jgi:hypothetical protein